MMPVTHSPGNIGIHAVEILLVQLTKERRIALRRLDQQPFISLIAHRFSRSRQNNPAREAKGYGWARIIFTVDSLALLRLRLLSILLVRRYSAAGTTYGFR